MQKYDWRVTLLLVVIIILLLWFGQCDKPVPLMGMTMPAVGMGL